MKRILLALTLLLGLFTVISCGPNSKEIAKKEVRDKFILDSTIKATVEQAVAKEKAKLDSTALMKVEERAKLDSTALMKVEEKAKLDSIALIKAGEVTKERNQLKLKRILIELKAQLAGAETKMNDIQEFHFGRLTSEKEQQVTNQTRVLEELKSQIVEIKKQIN